MEATRQRLSDQLAAQDVLLTRLAEQSLYAYLRQAWPILEPGTPFVENWHIPYLAEHLEAVTVGDITRLLINLPPSFSEVDRDVPGVAHVGVDQKSPSPVHLCQLRRIVGDQAFRRQTTRSCSPSGTRPGGASACVWWPIRTRKQSS